MAAADHSANAGPVAVPSMATSGDTSSLGLRLGAYRLATSVARPLVPLILGFRERQGKEEVARLPERYGVAGMARPEGRLVWLHAASVGETNAILPLIQALGAEQPRLSFLLTTGTVTSATMAGQRLGPRALHQYAPLDSVAYVRRFLKHWRPDLAVLTESEIWPNLVVETAAFGIPLALVNARMSDGSFLRWRQSPVVAKAVFGRFCLVLTQNERIGVEDLMLSNLATTSESGEIPSPKLATYEPQTLEEVERRHIQQTLSATGWNKSRAALILGIERSTLDRKIKSYGLVAK